MNSHHLMAAGFIVACLALLRIRRFAAAALCLAAAVEAYACLRYPVHDAARTYLLERVAGHEGKVQFQTEILIGLAVAVGLGVLATLPWLVRQPVGRQMMATGGLILVTTFGVELVSLHHIDAIIYQMIGPFAVCAVIYFIGAALVTGGALIEARRPSGIRRSVQG